jgi:hypothetical protein
MRFYTLVNSPSRYSCEDLAYDCHDLAHYFWRKIFLPTILPAAVKVLSAAKGALEKTRAFFSNDGLHGSHRGRGGVGGVGGGGDWLAVGLVKLAKREQCRAAALQTAGYWVAT